MESHAMSESPDAKESETVGSVRKEHTMCFSAAASFIGGGVLTALGTTTILTNKEPSRRLFAAIPFVFGVQQISEGFVWVSLQSPDPVPVVKAVSITLFLIAAVLVWPTVVPLSMLLMEKEKKRRAVLWVLTGLGVAVSLAHVVGMLVYTVTARIDGLHILYALDSPFPLAIVTMCGYLLATILPMFASSVKRVYVFGLVVVVSYVVAELFYREYLVSVWCFFGAIASAVIWWVLKVREPARIAVPETVDP
jgi:hypothetical protein